MRELSGIYAARGLGKALAETVAEQLMAHDALEAHARDELGISDAAKARPVLATLASAASFASGALLPLLVALAAPEAWIGWAVGGASLAGLAILGALGAAIGGSRMTKAAARVVIWGVMAMAVTAAAGRFFGARA